MSTTNDVTIRTDSQGPTTMIVAIFFGVLTLIVIALRLIARIGILRHVGLDDGKCLWKTMETADSLISLDNHCSWLHLGLHGLQHNR